jgi:hypothetical protein
MAAVFGGLAGWFVSKGGMPAIFSHRISRRWAYAWSDPIEFWFGVVLLTLAALGCLWSFFKHRSAR